VGVGIGVEGVWVKASAGSKTISTSVGVGPPIEEHALSNKPASTNTVASLKE
jgi:hypothetical protein